MNPAAERRWLNTALAPEAARLTLEVIDPSSERLRLLPARFWQALDPELLVLFATIASRWCIVTAELVAWLRDRIAGRKAIEIGAGMGDLGFHLGIAQTDSYAHVDDPVARHRFTVELGQPGTRPPADVRKLDALNAVHALRPEVVVAAWATEQGPDGFHAGVRETAILKAADYILIGNTSVHRKKPILATPHEEYRVPWLVSRAIDPTLDRIWTWKRQTKRGARG